MIAKLAHKIRQPPMDSIDSVSPASHEASEGLWIACHPVELY
jgi:hypothetical protein